jgi:hypothetical protein
MVRAAPRNTWGKSVTVVGKMCFTSKDEDFLASAFGTGYVRSRGDAVIYLGSATV